MQYKVISFTVPKEYDGDIAKNFLKRYCKISTAALISLKNTELGITRNGKLLKVIDKVYENDVIKIKLAPDKNEIIATKGTLDILYEDDYVIVINKPYNMPVHPTKIHQENTLANFLKYYSDQKGEKYTFRAINRLDKDTSGIVIVAKDRYCAANLGKNIQKTYCAVCEGIIKESGTVDAPIKIKDGHTIEREISPLGQRAVTHFKPIKHSKGHTLLEITLETGRTHQIRCHLASISHPLAGDDMYGGSLRFIKRQALHCRGSTFLHPITNKLININTEIPVEFLNILREDK